jgi:hypothetical protein
MNVWLEKNLGLLASSCFLCIHFEMCFICILSRVFFYDVVTGFIVLVDKANGLLVDLSGALDGQSRLWATERLSVIMVIGHLEVSSASVGRLSYPCLFFVDLDVHWQTPLPILPTPTNIPSFRLNDHVLRAILVIPAAGLDLDMWNAVLEEEEIEQQNLQKRELVSVPVQN